MAERFACDPDEAFVVARELVRMRSDLQNSSNPFDGATVASEEIAAALDDFLAAVSETQAGLLASVDHASGLFAGLSDGTLDLDQAFAAQASET
jgi:hypothetical protein